MCQYAYIILLAEDHSPECLQDLKELMASPLQGAAPASIPVTLPRTLQTLQRLASLKETIDFFLHFCAALFLVHFPPGKQWTLSAREELRIKRAILRFHLYAQLFHQPEATDEIVSDRDWEGRIKLQHYFWTRYEGVEAEECKCIYTLLVDSLVRTLAVRPSAQPEFDLPEKSIVRGLRLLRPVFVGINLTPLEASYAHRFVDYAFDGFGKVDPHDGNYFLPYHDFQNPDSPHPKRYRPSEAFREWNFGVLMYRQPKKYHPVVRIPDRTAWRLIGYCFWDEERIDFEPAQLIW